MPQLCVTSFIFSGNIEVLEWFYQHITEYPAAIMDRAASHGHLHGSGEDEVVIT